MNGLKNKLFGVALDPSDDPFSLELKQAWISKAADDSDGTSNGLDPHDALLDSYPQILEELRIEDCGKFPVPSWLWPRPPSSEMAHLSSSRIAEYYDSGQFERLLNCLQGFVEKEILPGRAIMLGVDHAATSAVVSALSRQVGADQLCVIVLDQHFDGMPPSVRAAQVEGAGRPITVADHLCCGNFWSYLIKSGRLLAQNLSLIGVADYPDAVGKTQGQNLYRDSYLAFEKAGVRFFPLAGFEGSYLSRLTSFINEAVRAPYLYLSVDLDVGSYRSVLAARYMDRPGLSSKDMLQIGKQVRAACEKKKGSLAGFDFVEFNQHFLGIEMEDGLKDETLPLVVNFMRAILS